MSSPTDQLPHDSRSILLARIRALASAGQPQEAVELLLSELGATKILESPGGESKIEVPDNERRMAALHVIFFVERGEWPSADSRILMFQVDDGRWLRGGLHIRPPDKFLFHWIDYPTAAESAALSTQVAETIGTLVRSTCDAPDTHQHPRAG